MESMTWELSFRWMRVETFRRGKQAGGPVGGDDKGVSAFDLGGNAAKRVTSLPAPTLKAFGAYCGVVGGTAYGGGG